jgi:hypothetical protein
VRIGFMRGLRNRLHPVNSRKYMQFRPKMINAQSSPQTIARPMCRVCINKEDYRYAIRNLSQKR